jgi:predicted RNA-binding protein with TRAM domain
MQGPIWHVKVRRVGQADYEIAEIRMDGRGPPKEGEIINVGITDFGLNGAGMKRENILAKVVSFTESTAESRTRYTVLATEEDNGNPVGHREATERDFQ